MKGIIIVIITIFFNTFLFGQTYPEGSLITNYPDPVNISVTPQLGFTWDGTKYWVTSENPPNPTETRLYTLDSSFNLIEVNSNLGAYYVSLAYRPDGNYIIAASSNKIVRLNGSSPTTISEDANDWFTPPGGTARAITYGGNGYLWVVAGDNYVYKVDINSSFASHNAQTSGSPLWITSPAIKGITYDGYFLWVFDANGDLYKEDINNSAYIATYALGSMIYNSKGDITYNGMDVILYGSDSGANFYTISIAPKPVLNLQAQDKGTGNTVTVSWNAPDDTSIIDYVIKWDTTQFGSYSSSNVISSSQTSIDITGLSNFQTYYFIVSGRDSVGATMSPSQLQSYYYVTSVPTKPPVIFTVNQTSGPYTDIASAIAAASKGDIIEITDNAVYNEFIFIDKPYLTLRSAEGITPTITYGGFNPVITIGSNNVNIEGIKFEKGAASSDQPVVDIFSYKVTIDNCTITADNTSYNYTGIRINNIISNRIENCDIGGNLYTAISNSGVGTTIINNKIHDAVYGIVMSEDGNIYLNTIHNVQTGIKVTDNAATYNIFYNTIYDCNNYGINISQENIVYIYNNTVVRNNYGIYLNYFTSGYPSYLFNNIVYNSTTYDIYINNNTMPVDHYIQYNCYASLYKDNDGNYYMAQNIISQAPLFKDENNNDFSLTSSSPCIDTGDDIDYSVYNEIFPQVYNRRDIGAYEYIPPAASSVVDNVDSLGVTLSANNLHPGDTLNIVIYNFSKITSEEKVSVTADIYSINGRKICTLENRIINSSDSLNLIWDGKNSNNQYISTGLYLLYIKANNAVKVKKFFWVR